MNVRASNSIVPRPPAERADSVNVERFRAELSAFDTAADAALERLRVYGAQRTADRDVGGVLGGDPSTSR